MSRGSHTVSRPHNHTVLTTNDEILIGWGKIAAGWRVTTEKMSVIGPLGGIRAIVLCCCNSAHKPGWEFLYFYTTLKASVGRIFLASLGKNSIITFQHIVIQVFWEKTRLLHLLMALFSGFKKSSPWRETLANHRSFQRESVPIGCAPAGGRCLVFPQLDLNMAAGSQTFSFYS